MISDYLALAVAVIGVPLNWFVVVRLWRLWKLTGNHVVRERCIAATALAVVVTVFALIFLNNDQAIPPLSLDITRVLTRGVLLGASIAPPCYWLWLYR